MAAQELRETLGVQMFALAIGPSVEQLASLSRMVGGAELAGERLLRLGFKFNFNFNFYFFSIPQKDSVNQLNDPNQLAFLRKSLCAQGGGSATTQGWAKRHAGTWLRLEIS